MNLSDQLIFKPHNQLADLARAGVPVHVFVNPVEYHGPHLSLGNDRILSERIALKLHEQLTEEQGDFPFVVGGHLDFGCDPCPGPGSVGVSYNQLKASLRKLVDGLLDLGVQRVAFHTFHGSPFHQHALDWAVQRLQDRGARAVNLFSATIDLIVNFDPVLYQPLRELLPSQEDFERVLAILPSDHHAGFFETSVALHVAPETVSPDYRKVPDCPPLVPPAALMKLADALHSRELENSLYAMAWVMLKPFPGYTGIPSLATPEVGRFYVEDLILPRYRQRCRDVLWGALSSPRAGFRWTRPLAPLLGGRI